MSRASNSILADARQQPAGGFYSWRSRSRRLYRPSVLLGISAVQDDAAGEDLEQQSGATSAAPGSIGDAGSIVAEGGGKIGIGWVAVASVLVSQVAIVSSFLWLASPEIRQQVASLLLPSLSSAGLGLLGAVPLVAFGLFLDTKDWEWVKKVDEITQQVTISLFGSERQVGKVTAIAIPLAILVGFAEEFTFRGYLPLILAAKTGLPTAAIVLFSSVIFGALHAATWAYFISATVYGVYSYGLLLATGNIFVPIAAHAIYDAFAFLRYHLKVTKPQS